MRVALKEVDRARVVLDVGAQGRAWKLFLLLPRMLLHRPPRGGLVAGEVFDFRVRKMDAALDRQSVLCNPNRNCFTSRVVCCSSRFGRVSSGPWDSSNVGCASEF